MTRVLFESAALRKFSGLTENPNGVQSFSPGLERSDYPGLKAQTIKARCRRRRERPKRERVYICFPFPSSKRLRFPSSPSNGVTCHQGKSNHCDLIKPLLLGLAFIWFEDDLQYSVRAFASLREVSGPLKGNFRNPPELPGTLRNPFTPPGGGVLQSSICAVRRIGQWHLAAAGAPPPFAHHCALLRTVAHHCQPFPQKIHF